jgi:hypothetical protein
MVCENYDLCHRCHSAGIHDEHQMLKIEHPHDALSVQSVVRILLFDLRKPLAINIQRCSSV